MAPRSAVRLHARQDFVDGNADDGWWYYSETAFIVKWVITGLILLGLILFFAGGYLHAQRRMKKGLPPLRYHRWLISRQQRERFFPPPTGVYYHRAPYGHRPAMPMDHYGPAPPAYGEQEYVPPYAPPEGASKVNPDQTHAGNQPSGPAQPEPVAGVNR